MEEYFGTGRVCSIASFLLYWMVSSGGGSGRGGGGGGDDDVSTAYLTFVSQYIL